MSDAGSDRLPAMEEPGRRAGQRSQASSRASSTDPRSKAELKAHIEMLQAQLTNATTALANLRPPESPFAEVPPPIKPIVKQVEEAEAAGEPKPEDPSNASAGPTNAQESPAPLPAVPPAPPLPENPTQPAAAPQNLDLAAALLKIEEMRLQESRNAEKLRLEAEQRAEERAAKMQKEHDELLASLLQQQQDSLADVGSVIDNNAKQLKMNRESVEMRRDKQSLEMTVPKPPLLTGKRETLLQLVHFKNELRDSLATLCPAIKDGSGKPEGYVFVEHAWEFGVKVQFPKFLTDQSHRFENSEELTARKLKVKDKNQLTDVDAKIIQEVAAHFDGDLTKWLKDATKLDRNPFRTGPRTLAYIFYKAMTVLYDGRQSTTPWQRSIQDYAFVSASESSPLVFQNDLQNVDWLIGFAEIIEANVDARDMAERIAKVVFEHNGSVWFQEPAYNFAFFASAAQKLKYPLLKASQLATLRARITEVIEEIEKNPTVSEVHLKKTKGDKNDAGAEKGRRAPETSPDSQPVTTQPITPQPPSSVGEKSRRQRQPRTDPAPKAPPSAAGTEEHKNSEVGEESENSRAMKLGNPEKVCLFYKHCGCSKPNCTFLHPAADFKGDGYCKKCNFLLTDHVDGKCPTWVPRKFPKKSEDTS